MYPNLRANCDLGVDRLGKFRSGFGRRVEKPEK